MTTRALALLLIATLSTPTAAQVTALAPDYTVEKFNIGGDGGSDYLAIEPGTGRVFVARQTHVMVVEGRTGHVLGDIPDTPRVHGIALSLRWNHGFTTNAGDSTVTMFDLNTLAPIKKIKIRVGGLDGIMCDEINDRVVLTNHSRPKGTATVIDPRDGRVIGNVELEDTSPEGAVADDRGRVYVNNETKSTIQVFDLKTLKVLHSWPIAPCKGPTGIAIDLRLDRVFSACDKKSVAVDITTGKVVASWANGEDVDALAWDAGDHVLYVPSGRTGDITVVRMISPNSYKPVKTIKTMPGVKTLAHDPMSRVVFAFQPEYGPAPAGATHGPIKASWLFRISR